MPALQVSRTPSDWLLRPTRAQTFSPSLHRIIYKLILMHSAISILGLVGNAMFENCHEHIAHSGTVIDHYVYKHLLFTKTALGPKYFTMTMAYRSDLQQQ